MDEPVSALDAHLGYWLRYVSNQVSHAFSLALAGQGVTVAEWVMLRELYAQPRLAPSVIADRLGMTRGAISKLADRLAAKALLTKTADASDRRYQDLALTAEGRALVPVLARLADRNDEAFFGGLEPGQRQVVMSAMKQIVRALGLKTAPVD